MGFVRFCNDRYDYCDQGHFVIFSEDGKHNFLFDYISKDLSRLSALLEHYVAKRMDITTFALKGYQQEDDYEEIISLLSLVHPFHKHECKEVFIDSVADYFNALLAHSEISCGSHKRSYVELRAWYLERLEVLTAPALQTMDSSDKLEKFHSSFRELVCANAHESIEEFLAPARKDAKGFFHELKTQEIIKRMLFWILDLSVPGLATLTLTQRVWLYANVFKGSSLNVEKHLSFGSSSLFRAGEDRSDEVERLLEIEDVLTPFYGHAMDFHINEESIPIEALSALQCAVDYAIKAPKEEIYVDYDITDIRQLLVLEISSMIEKNMGIRRCKNCGLYFDVTNHNREYCERIVKGKEKSCAMLGAKLTFEKKVKGDKALEIYNRAYKTHHARCRTGNMSRDEFESWRTSAKANLELVRVRKMDISEFEKWAKL